VPVPKQDKEYWSKHDDGIFVMKYFELWDPYMNMIVQFRSSNINDIRVTYVSDMIFSKHNEMNSAKEQILNFEAMVSAVYFCFQNCVDFFYVNTYSLFYILCRIT